MKKKLIQISEPVFKSTVHVLLNYTFEEMNEFFVKHKHSPTEELHKGSKGLAITEQDDKGIWFHSIWLPINEWLLSGQSVLVHELAHTIFSIFKVKGIDIDEGNNETFCYLQEYYFKEFCLEINKHVGVKKKSKKKK